MLDNTQISLIKERLYKYSGIFLNDSKLTMIKNRIYHLMHETHINSIDSLLSSIETNPKIQQQFINSFTTNMLQKSKEGIYAIDFKIDKFPNWCDINEYFDPVDESNTPSIPLFKVKDKLKSMVTFKQMNLFDRHYPFMHEEFDILFCRNVLIYFKQEDQPKILSKLIDTLRINGTFYLGHSETLYHLQEKFEKLGNKAFIKIKA